MAWATMHFATGMACGGVLAAGMAVIRGRGWKWTAPIMTLGGIWGMGPDLPRIFREDFPSLPFATMLGSPKLEAWLFQYGNFFAFHKQLDMQPHEFALHGLALIILLFNVAFALSFLDHKKDTIARWSHEREKSRHSRHRKKRSQSKKTIQPVSPTQP